MRSEKHEGKAEHKEELNIKKNKQKTKGRDEKAKQEH